MAQQHQILPGSYRQGPGTDCLENDMFCFQEDSAPIGSASMDRGLGSNNSSTSTDTSTSSWTKVTWNSTITPSSSMSSWEEVSPRIKWEDTADNSQYSPAGSQGFQTPIFHPSPFTEPAAFTEPTIDPRPTPTSLEWVKNSQLLNLYKLVVPKGKDPYFQLLEGYAVSYQTPQRVFLDRPEYESFFEIWHNADRSYREPKKGAYPCRYPWGCTGKQNIFTRPADLERHYKNVHAPEDQKDSFRCDYHKCGRFNEPFTRKDHYRDHIRDYHKEDLGCAKGEKKSAKRDWAASQKSWLAERKISCRWWRCARCLIRVQVNRDEWECPTCKASCEQERIEARLKQHRQRASAVDPTEVEDEPGYQAASSATVDAVSMADAQYECLEDETGYQTASSATVDAVSSSSAMEYYECPTCPGGRGWVDNGFGQWDACPTCAPSYSSQL
ncbi:hypothetical protein EG329_007775 [Mollisiaceae sp. DMI_Dod_QoI]|nr:hypothetical protein EG329_007775 [Helotiales sp. DMI_Dod_QoI]